jgi:hypothetical protein
LGAASHQLAVRSDYLSDLERACVFTRSVA